MYAACVYDNKWYIGNILEVSKEFGDVFVDFMKTGVKVSHDHQKRTNTGYQLQISIITTLVASCHGARSQKIFDNELQNVVEKFENISQS